MRQYIQERKDETHHICRQGAYGSQARSRFVVGRQARHRFVVGSQAHPRFDEIRRSQRRLWLIVGTSLMNTNRVLFSLLRFLALLRFSFVVKFSHCVKFFKQKAA